MTEIKAGCIQEEGTVGVKLERARRAALTRGELCLSSAGEEAGMLERKEKIHCVLETKKAWELSVKRVWMGVTQRLIHFSFVCNKGSVLFCVEKEENGIELGGLFMETELRPSGEPLYSQLRGLKYW